MAKILRQHPGYKINCSACMQDLRGHSKRWWTYRAEIGWVFDELAPEELTLLDADHLPGAATVRYPLHTRPSHFTNSSFRNHPGSYEGRYKGYERDYENWFGLCVLIHPHPLVLELFELHPEIDDWANELDEYSPTQSVYEGWLWADEVELCRLLGSQVVPENGWGWWEWFPPELPRLECKERTYIYALVDPLTRLVHYVGKANNPELRFTQHLRDEDNKSKAEWIQSLHVQKQTPTLNILEEVSQIKAFEREAWWITYYQNLGHPLTNSAAPYTPTSNSYQVIVI